MGLNLQQGIVLKAEPAESTMENFGLILTFMCTLPPMAMFVLATPYSKYVTDADARASALATLASAVKTLRRCCGAAEATRQRGGRVAPATSTKPVASSAGTHASSGLLSRSTRPGLLRRDPDASCGVCPACNGYAGRAADKAHT